MQSRTLGHAGECSDVFWKAGTAKPDASMQESWPDALIRTDPLGYHRDVGSEPLAQAGNVVDERDLGREKRICRVLDQFGGTMVRADYWRIEGRVERRNRLQDCR